jgi:hypothetical protein
MQGLRNERKRTQPIVIAHQHGQRRFVERSRRQAVDVYMSNEGAGPAFNVRFGVEFHGVRIPYKHDQGDDPAGTVYRFVRAQQRLPDHASWPLEFEQLFLLSEIETPENECLFWARYENAQGKAWETRNPADRSSNLVIKRVRLRRWREWREGRARQRARDRAAENERAIVQGLQQQGQQAAEGTPEQPRT